MELLLEYFVSGIALYLIKNHSPAQYSISECSWGTDEYDAFTRLVKKFEKECHLETPFLKLFCKLKATGRTKLDLYESPKPFFDNDDNQYVRGRISEFWVRFSMAETKEQLYSYGDRFKQYVDEYPFSELSVIKLWQKYLQQKDAIEAEPLKLSKFDLTQGLGVSLSPKQKLNHYTNKAVEFLKARGFRIIEKQSNLFEITSTDWHEFYFKGETWSTSALGLILYWEFIEPKLDKEYATKSIIPGRKSVLTYLGQRIGIQEQITILKAAGLTPFVLKEDIGIESIYVVQEEEESARKALSKARTSLVDDYTGQLEFEWDNDGLGKEYWENVDNIFGK
jgi:hypothetical protein